MLWCGGRRTGPRIRRRRRLLPVADPVAGEVVLAVEARLVGPEDGDGWVGVLLDPLEGGPQLGQEGRRRHLRNIDLNKINYSDNITTYVKDYDFVKFVHNCRIPIRHFFS